MNNKIFVSKALNSDFQGVYQNKINRTTTYVCSFSSKQPVIKNYIYYDNPVLIKSK